MGWQLCTHDDTSVYMDSSRNVLRVYLDFVVLACFFFFQAEDGIRDDLVTGVQTCALPIRHARPGYSMKGRSWGSTVSFWCSLAAASAPRSGMARTCLHCGWWAVPIRWAPWPSMCWALS